MSIPQYYPVPPPAGQYPYPSPQPSYYQPPQTQAPYSAQQYPPSQQYGQQLPPYPVYNPPNAPPSVPAYPAYPQPSWRPAPPLEGGFHHPAPEQGWDPQKVWAEQNGVPDYNNPPEPMYGTINDGSDNFVKPDRGLEPALAQPGGDGMRGLGATLIGGAGGAFLGHKVEHGALGTLGGLALGALAANAFEKHEHKKKEHRHDVREYDDGYVAGERRGSYARAIEDNCEGSERSGSRARAFDGERNDSTDRYYSHGGYDDYDPSPPHHHHQHHHDQSREYDDGEYRSAYGRDGRDGYGADYRNEYQQRDGERY